jgi:phosphoesterase RecJ-like protein
MANDSVFQEIINKLASARKIFLATHENPDGDAVASICAFAEWLRLLGKEFYLFCADEPDDGFHFLPQMEKINRRMEEVDFGEFDVIIVLDCGTLRRTKIETEIKASNLLIINIDHHISNDEFGQINLVDADAASTTQLLYELFKYSKLEISRQLASCILTGIITDSGSFAYAATNANTFSVASEMLTRGANVRAIVNYTEKNKNLSTLKAWGYALSQMHYNGNYDIAYTVITQEDLIKFNITKQDLEGLASFLNNLKDAKIILVLYELGDGRVKGSLRTNLINIDVARLAQVFGGGGHRKAAGFEVEGKLEQESKGWKVI